MCNAATPPLPVSPDPSVVNEDGTDGAAGTDGNSPVGDPVDLVRDDEEQPVVASPAEARAGAGAGSATRTRQLAATGHRTGDAVADLVADAQVRLNNARPQKQKRGWTSPVKTEIEKDVSNDPRFTSLSDEHQQKVMEQIQSLQPSRRQNQPKKEQVNKKAKASQPSRRK